MMPVGGSVAQTIVTLKGHLFSLNDETVPYSLETELTLPDLPLLIPSHSWMQIMKL